MLNLDCLVKFTTIEERFIAQREMIQAKMNMKTVRARQTDGYLGTLKFYLM